MAKLLDIRVVAVPRNHSEPHTYSLKRLRSGTYDFYLSNSASKNAKNRLKNQPKTLEEALDLLNQGYAARFKAKGPSYFKSSVFSRSTQDIRLVYE